MNEYLRSIVVVVAFSFLVIAGHSLILNLNPDYEPGISLYVLYPYLIISTVVVLLGLLYLLRTMPEQAGYIFLAAVTIKGGIAILLFPQLLSEDPGLTKLQVLNFLLPYFLFLGLEATLLIKWMNKS